MSAYKSNNLFQVILELNKIRITVAVALTTLTGYVLAKRAIDLYVLIPVAGIFILACGASVVNHLQEMKTDAKMDRTRKRPLPSGKMSKPGAIFLATVEIFAGLAILWAGSGFTSFLLGLTALIWYNVIYINLKRVTVHAVIPGSVIGSIPPLVGWVAAGGSLLDVHAWIIALFFFVWQVPHFYLLAYKYAADYKKAGFPSLLNQFTVKGIWIYIFIWILATVVTGLLIPVSGLTQSLITFAGIVVLSAWLVVYFLKPLTRSDHYSAGKFFMKINYYVLAVVLLQILDFLLVKIA